MRGLQDSDMIEFYSVEGQEALQGNIILRMGHRIFFDQNNKDKVVIGVPAPLGNLGVVMISRQD